DYRERPYGKTQLFTMNLQSFEVDSIWEGTWFGDARWSPDGKKLLLLGGPSMFGKLGQNVPEGKLPNEYDQQAYLMDFGSKNVQPLTKHFAPSIRSAIWNDPGTIYFSTIDHSYRTLYQYDLKSGTFTREESGVEVLNNVRIARNKPIAIYTGSGAASPKKAYLLDLKKKKYRLLSDPAAKSFKNVRFGKVEKWNFQNERGTTIEGRIYYPPDFKPSEKYPCIVYYYGGTSPVGRDFAGRYPKNYWAANGYVVYVLQPSGATGFGQAFSSLHVNDWGKIVADEIINGVSQFLAAHPFIDRDRVGAIGASYGGFMTELLLTKTDIFAAAVSHAGISSISSYWGEGYWGFLYSAVATANSFPWNRKDIYVDQSALFSADKINTPLLLLHGTDDTNVPPGESIQLYTALKLLGKTVEHIRVQGQNHLIMTYSRRKIWTRTIVAWFDRWLKNQPQWWNDLYPAK
ncbi:MAG TPA: S9 family peptidase, partial [Caldithrix sp.]|nr:S9 family peptidase [Caldithrix sp.]